MNNIKIYFCILVKIYWLYSHISCENAKGMLKHFFPILPYFVIFEFYWIYCIKLSFATLLLFLIEVNTLI